jgi:hypothetical protein
MNTQEIENLVSIGLCQPKFYKRSVWARANTLMLKCAQFGLVKPHDFGRGKGKYTTDLTPREIAEQYQKHTTN